MFSYARTAQSRSKDEIQEKEQRKFRIEKLEQKKIQENNEIKTGLNKMKSDEKNQSTAFTIKKITFQNGQPGTSPVKERMNGSENRRITEINAATKIQSLYRAKVARDKMARRRSEIIQQQHSAILIQSLIRGKKARNQTKMMRRNVETRQSTWRSRQHGSSYIVDHSSNDNGNNVDGSNNDRDRRNNNNRKNKLRRFHYQDIGNHHSKYTVYVCGLHIDHCVRRTILNIINSRQFKRMVRSFFFVFFICSIHIYDFLLKTDAIIILVILIAARLILSY
jgi:hypothetical protein